MAQDPRYITTITLEPYFVDKTTGAPLGGGKVWFYQDLNRTTPKLVYELTGAPPNYTFSPLPNPITLSSVGTIQDQFGNNVALYYYPYDAAGNIQQYYIVVEDSLGEEQFTREAWPDQAAINSSSTTIETNITNQLTNSQFAEVLFVTPTLTVNYTGVGTTVVQIAANWNLNIAHSGNGSLTVTQTSITGIQALPGNPPYTLTITPGANITALTMNQRLTHNPDIWSPAPGGVNGWLAATILLAPGSSIQMQYAPSQGPAQTVLTANNLTGAYTQFNNTVQLAPATNTDNSDVGYVDIVLVFPTGAATTFSNVQVVGLETNIPNVPFAQIPFVIQEGQKFNFFLDDLLFKPISSYLIAWDFPLNPAQFLGSNGVGPFATGANTSSYFWDQTIIFQSADSGVRVDRYLDGSLVVTAEATTQLAFIQYLEANTAKDILDDLIACNVNATTNQVGGIPMTISLWYTTGTLPDMNTNDSIVATLDANGKPATFNNGSQPWVEVERSNLGDATFTLPLTGTRQNYGFAHWNAGSATPPDTATFFAIVVGTGTLNMGQTITVGSISAVPGNIPTIPAIQSLTAVILDCCRYYEKSFNLDVVPASGTGLDGSPYFAAQNRPALTPNNLSGSYPYKAPKVHANPLITIYNPVNLNNQIYNTETFSDCAMSAPVAGQQMTITFSCTTPAASSIGENLEFHWTSDCRLGIV